MKTKPLKGKCEQLKKGIEEEVYISSKDGQLYPIAPELCKAIPAFCTEPDARNPEHVTKVHSNYESLKEEILSTCKKLNDFIAAKGECKILPGSTMALGDSKEFIISDPENEYYRFICNEYFTDVVTASLHLNLGIEDPEDIVRICRVLKYDAFAYLALSAASPFLDNEFTGYHSYRWHTFPKVPKHIPIFRDFKHYQSWFKDQLKNKEMFNSRHLWDSVRPNGNNVPESINRIELRICDHSSEINKTLAFLALFESRVLQILSNPSIDPLQNSSFDETDYLRTIEENEKQVAKLSLESKITDWKSKKLIWAKDWIEEYVSDLKPYAERAGFTDYLSPLQDILDNGNAAQKWIESYQAGKSIKEILLGE